MKSLTSTKKEPRSPKPRRSQEQRRQDTQERVLKAALDILAEEGYARFTTTAVAARAGVSRGAQENYFRTKTDLIAAATRYAMDSATAHAAKSAQVARTRGRSVAAFPRRQPGVFPEPQLSGHGRAGACRAQRAGARAHSPRRIRQVSQGSGPGLDRAPSSTQACRARWSRSSSSSPFICCAAWR